MTEEERRAERQRRYEWYKAAGWQEVEAGVLLVSPLKVLTISPAGPYIGRMCYDIKGGYEEPYSRESDYFETKKEAETAFESGEYGDDGSTTCAAAKHATEKYGLK